MVLQQATLIQRRVGITFYVYFTERRWNHSQDHFGVQNVKYIKKKKKKEKKPPYSTVKGTHINAIFLKQFETILFY